MTVRIRVPNWIIKKLKNKYARTVYEEHGVTLTDSQAVLIALLEFEAYQHNESVEINFKKNGKIVFKFR